MADHKKIIELVDEADENGRDLFRLLVDLQTHVQTALLAAIAQGGTSEQLGAPLTTEQLTRLLDGLHEGEHGVKHGLSQKINFRRELFVPSPTLRSLSAPIFFGKKIISSYSLE